MTCETENRWLATFRGRVGYAFDRWLPYVTAGGAYGNVKATVSVRSGLAASSSSDQFGWTVGVGLEYAFLGNWTAKIEYLYVDLGSFDTGSRAVVNNVSFKENIVRAGLNYKFSGPIFSPLLSATSEPTRKTESPGPRPGAFSLRGATR